MSDHAMTHVSDTTTSEALLALRELQPPTPPRDTILVPRTPPPVKGTEEMIRDVREEVSRLDQRVASLETTVHDNHVEVTKRIDTLDTRLSSLERKVDSLERKVDSLERKVDSLDRKFDDRFMELKEWGDAWTSTMKGVMDGVKVLVESNGLIMQRILEERGYKGDYTDMEAKIGKGRGVDRDQDFGPLGK